MTRAPFQVAIQPFRKIEGSLYEYAIFRRKGEGYWQGIAGGGEDAERPVEAAVREAFEEARIANPRNMIPLSTMTMIPTYHFKARQDWPNDLWVIPVYYFACEPDQIELILSHEHSEYRWVRYDIAQEYLHWDSDKTALWELSQRLRQSQSN